MSENYHDRDFQGEMARNADETLGAFAVCYQSHGEQFGKRKELLHDDGCRSLGTFRCC